MRILKQLFFQYFTFFLLCYSYICRIFLSKVPGLILFGAMKGNYYGDNSRHLYEWIISNRPDLKPVWLTTNKEVFESLKNQKKPVLLQYSMKAIRLLSQVQVATFTNSLKDLAIDSRLVPNSIKLVALRHGRSVKRVRFARLNHKISHNETLVRKYEGRLIKYAISTSDFISDLQEKCLHIGREKHVVTGYPRNDILSNPPKSIFQNWKNLIGDIQPERVILYAPTWRHGRAQTRFFPFEDFDNDLLVEFLEETKSLLLFRPHVNDLIYSKLIEFLSSLTGATDMIRMITHKEWDDVNSILPFVDILISDYSALYHDFLLLDRPIILIPYDKEDFEKENGFLYDYDKYAPGPIVNSFKLFMIHMQNIVGKVDEFSDRRHILCDKVHMFKDDLSCERTVKLFDNIFKEKTKINCT